MANKNRSKNKDNSMSTSKKIEKASDEKASRRHKEIRKRLDAIEDKQKVLESKVKKCIESEKYLCTEMSELQAKVNMLEQEKLKHNIIIKGVPEKETNDNELKNMVMLFLLKLSKTITAAEIVTSKRIGFKRASNTTEKRPIVVQLTNAELKETLLNVAKKASLNCFVVFNGIPIGRKEDKVFISEHLTKLNESLFFEARKLRRAEIVQFAWTKNGVVLIKQTEDSKPIRLASMEQLLHAKKKLGLKMSSTKVHNSDTESPEVSKEEQNQPESDDESGSGSDSTVQSESQRGKKRNSSFQHVEPLTQRPKRNTRKP